MVYHHDVVIIAQIRYLLLQKFNYFTTEVIGAPCNSSLIIVPIIPSTRIASIKTLQSRQDCVDSN